MAGIAKFFKKIILPLFEDKYSFTVVSQIIIQPNGRLPLA
jgi:hypothetical protein